MNAKAALLTINLDDKELICTIFEGDNPCRDAWELWEGIKHHWPDHVSTVVGNEPAREAHRAYRTATLLRNPDLTTPQTPEPRTHQTPDECTPEHRP